MNNNSTLCPQDETNSLEPQIVKKEDKILLQSISFLEEQISNNKESMKQLEEELSHMNIKYTYSNTGELMIVSENGTDNIPEQVLLIQHSYNTFHKKNTDIGSNIDNLRNYFLDQRIEDSMKQTYHEVEQKGLSILQAQEIERSRIACDLHDSIVQNLANLIHKTELCIKMMDRDPIGVKLDLQLVMQNIKTVINDIRRIIYNLKPMALDDLGLEIAIQRFLEQFELTHKVHVNFKCTCKNVNLETSVISVTLFRIIQEACTNAVKHGHAKVIDVSLDDNESSILMCIKDNGDGFDVKSVNQKIRKDNSGYGLSIMKERICLISGSVHINSKRNEGTIINVIVPIQR